MRAWDVIVAGLGTVGAATAMALARRGVSVLGLDPRRPPHGFGSHHGETRSIRRAYLEGTAYVPMALRAWELWRRLERDRGERLLVPTGNLTIGPEDCPAVRGFLKSARAYGIPHESLSGMEVAGRWAQLSPPRGFMAGLETEAGILLSERCVAAMVDEAARAGADLRFDQGATAWSPEGGGIRVTTPRGRWEAGRLLLSAGANTPGLLGDWGLALRVKSVSVFWIEPPPEPPFGLGLFPVNFWQLPGPLGGGRPGFSEYYSLPAVGAGVKVAPHNDLPDWNPENPDPDPGEWARVEAFVRSCIPALAGRPVRSGRCRYTLTPDGDFLLGPLPGCGNVFAAALAGHGFKFAPLLGELLADLIQGRAADLDWRPFSPDRFSTG